MIKNLIIGGLVAATLLLGGLTTWQAKAIGDLRTDVAGLTNSVATAKLQISWLKHVVTKQSTRIATLEKAAKKRKVREYHAKGEATHAVITGYSNDPISIDVPEWRDGMTATGTVARKGVCAADWRVFPPGTRFWVPGYGECVVEDRGGAIKGNKIDLFFNTYEEAVSWGVKRRDVFIIEMGKHGKWRV